MTDTVGSEAVQTDHDVVIVGGGPAGCSAGVFTARYGLDTLIFDRGPSSIRRCAHLENYLGFPAGIDIETFYSLMHAHVRAAGCELRSDLVSSVEAADGHAGFVVKPQDGRRVTGRAIVAATRYDDDYLRPLDADGAMFESIELDGTERERFDRSCPDHTGRTPIDGLYVASPSDEADRQAVIAAGRGARVGLAVVTDRRRERGYPDAIARRYDWVRRATELDDEWRDRDRWREWFDDRVPDDHELDEPRREHLRCTEIERRRGEYLTEPERSARRVRGQDRLLDHLDDEWILRRARELAVDRRQTGLTD